MPGLTAETFLDLAASDTIRSRFQPAGVTSLEGLLWPDTYYVSKADDTEEIAADGSSTRSTSSRRDRARQPTWPGSTRTGR